MSRASRIKRLLLATAQYGGIVLGTLIAADVACNALGVFPPTYEYGDPTVGWVAAPPMGVIGEYGCTEYSSGVKYTYTRNEDGVRIRFSAHQLVTDSERDLIAVTGDSQTDLCAPNEQTHPGVLEAVLNANGLRAVVLPYGAGRYSPLQDYLVFKKALLKYHPDAFVLNFYTGNDFYDMLRVDDRPHVVRTDSGYAVAPPVWYLYDSPGLLQSWLLKHSRVLFAFRSLAKWTGLHGLVQRLRVLAALASEQGKGLPTVLAYMNDLHKSREASVGYGAALAAQMLNQQLFFHRFPESRAEAIRRVRALLQMIRRENPDLLLILSPLPSYQLTQQQPVDDALLRTLARLPITYEEGVQEEQALYDTLRVFAREGGWLFVDNLRALRAYHGTDRLFNNFDYHLLPVASEIIGRAQAEALLQRVPPGRRSAVRVLAQRPSVESTRFVDQNSGSGNQVNRRHPF